MTEAAHAYTLLTAIKSCLSSGLSSRLTAIGTEATVTLPVPTAYTITSDKNDRANLPEVLIWYEGPADNDDWLTPQTDVTGPVRVDLQFQALDDETTPDQLGWYYVRAIQETLDAITLGGTGVWNLDIVDGDVEAYFTAEGQDRNRRTAVVRADVRFRTTRAIRNP